MQIRVNHVALLKFSEAVFQKLGVSVSHAFIISDSLVFANLRGIDSHGIMRLPGYVERIVKGGSKANPRIQIIQEKPSVAVVDGDEGLGQVVGVFAAELAVAKARETGCCYVGVKGSGHNGAASYYAMKMTESEMIGVSISNTTPVMAAWGGRKSAIGNNPLCIAAPYEEGNPLVLDIAMSGVAGGKVRLAAKNRERIPKGWILNSQGLETEDPNDLPQGGCLLPFGQHKGYALAVMIEVLSGVITGAGMLGQIPFWSAYPETSLNIGHAFIAIDIRALMNPEDFKQRLAWMVKTLRDSPLAADAEEILMPGEIEYRTERERRMCGIPLSQEVWEDLRTLSKTFGLPLEPV